MKNKILLLMVLIASTLTSCLKANLDELPAFSNAEMTDVNFEFRSMSEEREYELLLIKCTRDIVIDSDNGYITVDLSVAADTSETFDVSLSDIACYTTISTAATVTPIGDAPTLGVVSDWTAMKYQYLVTAADGVTEKTWTIEILGFEDLR